jgi:subtilisin family serine protease
MLKKLYILIRSGFLMGLFLASGWAQHHYVLNAPAGNINTLCDRYGLQFVTQLTGSATGIYVVNSPLALSSILQVLQFEGTIKSVEEDISLPLPEAAKSAALQSSPDTTSVSGDIQTYGNATDDLGDGTTVWSAYVNQTAASIIKVKQSHSFATGAGAVAILDTGVDFMNPVLRNSLIWGYDFINNVPMGQAMPFDLSSSTGSILDQSTTSILDQSTTSILDSNSTIILDQSTTSILDQSTTSILDGTKPINDWGHGTMVAGLVHLVAPSAKILPVKVFNAHGGSSLSLIIQGIHYAVDSGARVINMSFSMTGYSQQLADAIDFANRQGVILVAAAGNEGQYMTVYPAGYKSVIGVGATDNHNLRTSFSNFGPVVDLAAPGAGVITTYPGNRYAAGWGTSFSAPMVAGAAALFVQMDGDLNGQGALQAADQADSLGEQQLGAGLLDLVLACASFH